MIFCRNFGYFFYLNFWKIISELALLQTIFKKLEEKNLSVHYSKAVTGRCSVK